MSHVLYLLPFQSLPPQKKKKKSSKCSICFNECFIPPWFFPASPRFSTRPPPSSLGPTDPTDPSATSPRFTFCVFHLRPDERQGDLAQACYLQAWHQSEHESIVLWLVNLPLPKIAGPVVRADEGHCFPLKGSTYIDDHTLIYIRYWAILILIHQLILTAQDAYHHQHLIQLPLGRNWRAYIGSYPSPNGGKICHDTENYLPLASWWG